VHARQEELGELVAHHRARALGERLQQPAAVARLRLDVRVVRDPGPAVGRRVVGGAVEREAVQPVVRPRVAGAQRLEHDERPPPLGGEGERVLEREVVARAPGHHLPVEHVAAPRVGGGGVGGR
jgi:hypothetical protein